MSGRADAFLLLPGSCLSGQEVLTPGAVLPGMAQLRAHIHVFSSGPLALLVFHVRFFINHVTTYLFSLLTMGVKCVMF